MQLSDQQRDAVEYVGTPALVVAGAGSGKTRTLTSKIAHLVSNGYAPELTGDIPYNHLQEETYPDMKILPLQTSPNCNHTRLSVHGSRFTVFLMIEAFWILISILELTLLHLNQKIYVTVNCERLLII